MGQILIFYSAFDNYFLQAQRVRQLIKNDFDRVFSLQNYCSDSTSGDLADTSSGVDVLLHPSAIRPAPLLTESKQDASSLDSYVQDVLTVPASLAGLPAVSVPIIASPYEKGQKSWPIGVSVVGQWGTDNMVLSVGKMIEGLRSE